MSVFSLKTPPRPARSEPSSRWTRRSRPRLAALPIVAAAACLATGATGQDGRTIDPLYYSFSAHVEIERDGDDVVVRPPESRGAYRRAELRIPVVATLAESPRPATPGVVGIATTGDLLVNREPQLAPLGRSATPTGFGRPGVEVPRGPGSFGSELDLTALVGMMLDGYPLYGPADEEGDVPGDLDECRGHYGTTPDTEHAAYHYHVVVGAKLIVPCFRGVAGRAR